MSDIEKYRLKAVLNTSFKPVQYRIKGKEHYQVFLSIYSDSFDPELSEVLYVEYELHPTFKNRNRISKNRNSNFEIEIKTWGTFDIKVVVNLKNGEGFVIELNYSEVLEKKAL